MSQMQEVNKGGKNVAKDSTSLGNMFEHTFRPKQTRSSNALKTNSETVKSFSSHEMLKPSEDNFVTIGGVETGNSYRNSPR